MVAFSQAMFSLHNYQVSQPKFKAHSLVVHLLLMKLTSLLSNLATKEAVATMQKHRKNSIQCWAMTNMVNFIRCRTYLSGESKRMFHRWPQTTPGHRLIFF